VSSRLLAVALLVSAVAGCGWVAATAVDPPGDSVTTTAPNASPGWTLVVLDKTTGRTSGVFAGPGDGPAVVPGFGFTESYLSQLRAAQSLPDGTLLSSVTGPDLRTDSTLSPAGAAGDGLRPVLAALAALGLVAAVLGGAGRPGRRWTGRAAAVTALLAAGGLAAVTAVVGVLGWWSPVLVVSGLAAGAAAVLLRRERVRGAPA
jgi:hypothetical protein